MDRSGSRASATGRLAWWRRAIAVVVLVAGALHGCASGVDPWQDARIEAEVKAQLVAQKNANLTRLGVASRQAVVHLTGTVESDEQKALAAGLAKGVPGVRRVVDDLRVGAVSP
jgi:BON domain-containing protein